jgi:hypothetical protein
MTKSRLVSALVALALVAAPSVALAHRDSGQSQKRSGKKHQVHKKSKKSKKTKVRQIVGSSASTTTPSSTTPPPSPATTATITKFENGDLTITLSNGKAYTAAVTDRTQIECEAGALPTARAAHNGDDDNQGDDNRGSGRGNDDGDDENGDSEHGDGDHNDDGHGDNGQVKCDTTALTSGTQVTGARLVIDSSGGTWKKLELVK